MPLFIWLLVSFYQDAISEKGSGFSFLCLQLLEQGLSQSELLINTYGINEPLKAQDTEAAAFKPKLAGAILCPWPLRLSLGLAVDIICWLLERGTVLFSAMLAI